VNSEKLYQLALMFTPNIGSVSTKFLISYCGSAENVFKTTKSKLLKIPNIGNSAATSIINKEGLPLAEIELQILEKENGDIIFYTDENYPERLKSINDAPALLFTKGKTNLNSAKVISIVGTRNSTDYGKDFTETLIKDISKYNDVIIISGLAFGIDIIAHKAALKYNIPTVGVMGSGLDQIYPSAHKSTAQQIINENGALLTEYKWKTKIDPNYFPARNRIVAGMCDAVIIVEAAIKGGALITAEIGNSYNKDVFAVPGNIGNKYSEGCNHLIKSHKANLLTGIEDLEYIMNWQNDADVKKKSINKEINFDHLILDEKEKRILLLLQSKKILILDDLSWQTQIPVNVIASLLLNLELQGLVKALPGKKFTLN